MPDRVRHDPLDVEDAVELLGLLRLIFSTAVPRTLACVRGKDGIVTALHGGIVNALDHHGVYPTTAFLYATNCVTCAVRTSR